MGPIFLNTNRNKRSVAVDLKKPAGLAVVRRLLADADVLIYNVRPNAMARLGLDYDDRRGDQARASSTPACSAFGQDGPYAARPAVRRPDPGRRDAAASDLGARAGPAALRAVRDGGSHRRPDGGRRHPRRAAGAANRPRPAPDVPMFETMVGFVLGDHLGGLSFEPPLDEGGYARQLSHERRPYRTERRLHLRPGLQRQSSGRGSCARHRSRVAAAGRRALRDLRQPLAPHRLRLRRAGADLRGSAAPPNGWRCSRRPTCR